MLLFLEKIISCFLYFYFANYILFNVDLVFKFTCIYVKSFNKYLNFNLELKCVFNVLTSILN